MTVEEIERILQTVAENQARHDEMHARHAADITEIDQGIESLLRSQNRYEQRLAMISDIMHDLADKHLKNEERFAELVEARRVNELRLDKLEASYELFEEFVRDFKRDTEARQYKLENAFQSLGEFVVNFRRETNGYFAETDKKLAALVEAQIRTDERFAETDKKLAALVEAQIRTDERFTETDKKLLALAEAQAKTDEQMKRTDERVDRLTSDIAALNGRAERMDERLDRIGEHLDQAAEAIKALAEAQARGDELFRLLLDRNGATKPKTRAKKPAKKAAKNKGGVAK